MLAIILNLIYLQVIQPNHLNKLNLGTTMKPNHLNKLSLGIVAAFLLALSLSANAQTTLYQQNFLYGAGGTGAGFNGAGGSGGSKSFSTAFGSANLADPSSPWVGFTGATAVNNSAIAQDFGIADRQAMPNNTDGFAVMTANFTGNYILAATPTGMSIATSPSLTFSWYQGDANVPDAFQLAVQIGSQWYASTTTFATAAQGAANFEYSSSTAVLESIAFSPTAANWDILNFTPTTTLSLGSVSGSDLSGNITGVGLYDAAAPSGNMRVATFTITSAPEPSSYALLVGGLALLVIIRRKRALV
jgi:PEP-CTERM motif-containing protein